ncbi:hypothetical protein EYF80_031558 [Liparis tanakae]|uniref:Uncharacterized protein n=1 Tax=Liparis tanakae TaxID=230148 RepID=A0A4Z2GX84_9TELE|nr:hypothetical protein EYF80_031558 [Liparis tanakae]
MLDTTSPLRTLLVLPLRSCFANVLLSSSFLGDFTLSDRGNRGWTGGVTGKRGWTGLDTGNRGWTGLDTGNRGWTGLDTGNRNIGVGNTGDRNRRRNAGDWNASDWNWRRNAGDWNARDWTWRRNAGDWNRDWNRRRKAGDWNRNAGDRNRDWNRPKGPKRLSHLLEKDVSACWPDRKGAEESEGWVAVWEEGRVGGVQLQVGLSGASIAKRQSGEIVPSAPVGEQSTHIGGRSLKGSLRLRPPSTPRAPLWDLPMVLDTLCSPPFETLSVSELRWLSAKIVFLLTITSAKRVSELHALSELETNAETMRLRQMVRLNKSEGKGVEGLKLHRTRNFSQTNNPLTSCLSLIAPSSLVVPCTRTPGPIMHLSATGIPDTRFIWNGGYDQLSLLAASDPNG